MLLPSFRDVAIVTVKDVDYRFVIHNIGKSKLIRLFRNSVLQDHKYE